MENGKEVILLLVFLLFGILNPNFGGRSKAFCPEEPGFGVDEEGKYLFVFCSGGGRRLGSENLPKS